MGREVRRVPKDWQHPKDSSGRHIPLHDRDFEANAAEWDEEYQKWQEGLVRNYGDGPEWRAKEGDEIGMWFSEWNGRRPCVTEYMPKWSKEDATHYMMYENTSEGTPISPAFETPEELAKWLADTGASAFGGMTASYESWFRVCAGGYAPSMVFVDGELKPGVEL